MEQSEDYKPEDVIVTEGENKGNIKDVELARVGAAAEDYKRDKIAATPLRSELNRALDGSFNNMESYKSGMGDDAGEKALKYEIGRRVEASAKEAGAQAHDAEKIASDAEYDFSEKQKQLAKERLNTALNGTAVVESNKPETEANNVIRETWEAIREKNKLEDGTYKSVMVTTYDPEWIKNHPDKVASDRYTDYNMDAPSEANSLVGTFDLVNTELEDLPKFWRGEGSSIFGDNGKVSLK